MKWENLFKVAFKSFFKNKIRCLLTMLGIIIGVSAVIIMIAIGQGAEAKVESSIASLGTNLIMLMPGAHREGGVSMGAGSGGHLTLDDVDKLKKNASLLKGVSPMVLSFVQAIGGIGNWYTQARGVSPDYLEIRDWSLASGEFFSYTDLKTQNKVCVLGQTVAKTLYPDQDPVGQQIRLRSVPFRIIGLLTPKGQSAMGQDQDDVILAPYTTVQNRLSGWRFIPLVLCSAISPEQIPAAQEEIRSIMRESHKIPEGTDDDFTVGNQTDITNAAEATMKVMTSLLIAIASVSLVVGGIGIMNIMLVSVTERTREIGIRMAVGARGGDILMQFLIEAVVLSLSGGIIGIVVGFIATELVGMITNWNTLISIPTVVLSFGFSGFVGIFFGFYPARKAASLNPIDALHYE